MGLTIQFSLCLPEISSPDEITARIAALHNAIAKLPFQSLTPMITLDQERIHQAMDSRNNSTWRWACIQYERHLAYRFDHLGAPHRVPAGFEPGTCHATIRPKTLIGFSCEPGDGCEPFNVFVGSYPNSTIIPYQGQLARLATQKRRVMLETPVKWIGTAFCKTQYASRPASGGVTNFLRCHLLVIAALDAARDLGFGVTVDDEGGYWEQRSDPALVDEVPDRNTMIVGVTEQLTASYGDAVQSATSAEDQAAPVNKELAVALGDDVLDLITRTKGSTTVASKGEATAPT